jgi:hypothetical protein
MVEAGKIRPLVAVAAEAGVGKVSKRRDAAVLLGAYVLNLEGPDGEPLGQPAVFAHATGALANLLGQ